MEIVKILCTQQMISERSSTIMVRPEVINKLEIKFVLRKALIRHENHQRLSEFSKEKMVAYLSRGHEYWVAMAQS